MFIWLSKKDRKIRNLEAIINIKEAIININNELSKEQDKKIKALEE